MITKCDTCKGDCDDYYVRCDCGLQIHYMCLYKAKVLSSHWTNSNPPKYAKEILSSPHFTFKCTTCLHKLPSSIDVNLQNSNNTSQFFDLKSCIQSNNLSTIKSINDLTLKIDKLLSISPSKSYASVLSDNLKNLNKINSSIESINSQVNIIKSNDDLSLVFENIPEISDCKEDSEYLSIFSNSISDLFNISLDNISPRFNFNSSKIILQFDTSLNKNKILNSKMKIKESRIFNDVFIRISLPSSELEKKKVLRHAIKANLIKSNTTLKCVFNNYSFKYEIHELKNNKIDWRNIVSEKDFSNWADSFSDYQKSFTTQSKYSNINIGAKSTHTKNE